jgi:hypothetical protein
MECSGTAACNFFHSQNVYFGQRSPIMRFFLFFLGFFSVHGEVSIKLPSKLHYLYFFSDILVVSYVLSCAVAARRQSGVISKAACNTKGVSVKFPLRPFYSELFQMSSLYSLHVCNDRHRFQQNNFSLSHATLRNVYWSLCIHSKPAQAPLS